MKRYDVIIQPAALAQIREAFEYIRGRSPANARRWLEGIYRKIEQLEMFPRGCPAAREAPFFSGELRQTVFKSHRIVFEIDGESVYVVYVRHVAMRSLFESPE